MPLTAFMTPFPDRPAAVVMAVTLTAATLFALGVVKAMASDQCRVRSGLELLMLASAAGITGYLIGVIAGAVFGLEV